MRALVTGGSGYLGSALARELARRGASVRVFDLRDAEDRPPSIEFVAGDIRDAAAVRAACAGVDVIHHCVAQVPLARDRALFDSVNRGGTETLLREARASGARKLVYVSSSAVYGAPRANPVTEATPPSPAEAYGRAKLAGEELCRRYAAEGLDVSIVRPRTVLGPGRLGLMQLLFELVAEGRNVPVLGRGDNVYQFVHVDDLADACLRAADRPGCADYNCGAEIFGTMRELLEALCRHAATGSRVRGVPRLPAELLMRLSGALGLAPFAPYHALMYGRSLYFDISKAKTELGWRPRHSNEAMILAAYDWYLEHRRAVLSSGGGSAHRSAVRQGVVALLKRLL